MIRQILTASLSLVLAFVASAFAQTTNSLPASSFSLVIAQSGAAPCTVYVHGLELPPPAHGSPLTARYEWDFGDSLPAPSTQPMNNSRVPAPYGPNLGYNRLIGWNAAHVYNSAGNYAINLKITDEAGEVRTFRRNITILADDRPIRRVRSFSALKSAATGVPAAHVLVETSIDVPETIKPSKGTVIEGIVSTPTTATTAPADPQLPSLRWINPSRGSVFTGEDFLLRNLKFTCPRNDDKTTPNVVRPAGKVTIDWCTADHIYTFVEGNQSPRCVLVKDCRDLSDTSIHALFCWVQGFDWTIVGNVIHNSMREHIVRCGGAERVNIAFNDFTNADRRPIDPYDFSKQTITAHLTRYVGLYDNFCKDGRIEIGPLGQKDGIIKPDYQNASMNCVQIIGNRLDFSPNNRLEIVHGADGVYICGNWIRTTSRDCIHLGDADTQTYWIDGEARTYGGRHVNNVWIRNDNTLITRPGDKTVYIAKSATNVRNDMR
jgi:hypothetical protein